MSETVVVDEVNGVVVVEEKIMAVPDVKKRRGRPRKNGPGESDVVVPVVKKRRKYKKRKSAANNMIVEDVVWHTHIIGDELNASVMSMEKEKSHANCKNILWSFNGTWPDSNLAGVSGFWTLIEWSPDIDSSTPFSSRTFKLKPGNAAQDLDGMYVLSYFFLFFHKHTYTHTTQCLWYSSIRKLRCIV